VATRGYRMNMADIPKETIKAWEGKIARCINRKMGIFACNASSKYLYLDRELNGMGLRRLSAETAIHQALNLISHGTDSKDNETRESIGEEDIKKANSNLKQTTNTMIVPNKARQTKTSTEQNLLLHFCKTGQLRKPKFQEASISAIKLMPQLHLPCSEHQLQSTQTETSCKQPN